MSTRKEISYLIDLSRENTIMAIGKSGRIVIDLDPEQKEKIHKAIKKKGMNLKEWFEQKVAEDFPEISKSHGKNKGN
jgi:DNA primase